MTSFRAELEILHLQNDKGGAEALDTTALDQYPNLAQKAEHDPAQSTAFEESQAWLDDESSDVMAALRKHPVIDRALAGSGEDEKVQLMGLYWMSRVDLKTLSMRLVELTAETDGRNAARGRREAEHRQGRAGIGKAAPCARHTYGSTLHIVTCLYESAQGESTQHGSLGDGALGHECRSCAVVWASPS